METLLLPALNLAVLLGFLFYKLKSPLGQFLVDRHKETVDGLDRTRKQVADAELRRAEIEKRLSQLSSDVATIQREWKEREVMQIKSIRDGSVRVKTQMKTEVETNKLALQETMRSDLINHAGKWVVDAVQEKIKNKLNSDRHQKLNQKMIQELAGV
jgi:F0F1-type ATP synthase membrane subunit b/b'